MKKLTIWFAIAAMVLALNPIQLKAEKDTGLVSTENTKTEIGMINPIESRDAIIAIPEGELAIVSSEEVAETAYAEAQLDRLNEIKEMDMSAMSSVEKNELKKEVRNMQKEKGPSGGIYVSVGAAILIVLLLILLL